MCSKSFRSSVLILCGALAAEAGANSASPFPVEVKQPTGESVLLYLRGTEKLNWYEFVPEAANATRGVGSQQNNYSSESARLGLTPGYTVVKDEQGRYVFAELDQQGQWQPSDQIVGQAPPAAIPRRLIPPAENVERTIEGRLPERNIPSRAASPVGPVQNLVVLLRFADHTGRSLPPRDQVEKLFNATSPVPGVAPTGSVRTFYKEISYGKLDLQSTVVDWVTLPNSEAYYANGQSGLTTRIHEALRDALEIIRQKNLVNFADFDNENNGAGDGWIDAITFVHSGYAAEFGGVAGGAEKEDRIWSHRWVMSPWTDPATGVKVSNYNINPGLWGISGNAIGRIGVICHELGHFFGLPDLYDYSGVGEGCGSWCLMANSWGFDFSQHHPPHMSAWCKIQLSWNMPKVISETGTYKLKPTTLPEATIYRINYPSGSADEYLLIENRQPDGEFDGGIPAGPGGKGGLAVWHIDDAMPENDRPGYPSHPGYPADHYKVGLIQADGNWDLERGNNRGDAGDVFRAGHVHEIGSETLMSYGGVKPPRIHGISATGQEMSFTYGEEDTDTPSDLQFARQVQVEVPTSHVVNFSPDGRAVTIILDRLVSDSSVAKTDVTDASFILPLRSGSGAMNAAVQIRGYASVDQGSAAKLFLSIAGDASVIDPKAHADPGQRGNNAEQRGPVKRMPRGVSPRSSESEGFDFIYEATVSIDSAQKLPITAVLIAEQLQDESTGALLVVDSIDVELQ